MKQTSAGIRLREIFASLAGRDGRDDVQKIEAAIERLQTERAAAQQELATLADERIERLLDDDDGELDKIDRRQETCHRVLERIDEAALPELQRRLELARDEQIRGKPYKSAAKKAVAVAKKLETRYGALAKELADLLAEVAEAEREVDAVNRSLPMNAEPLRGPEQMLRTVGARDEVIIEDKVVDRWAFQSNGAILADSQADNVVETGLKTGYLDSGAGRTAVTKRRVRMVTFQPREAAQSVRPLSEALLLPALRADEPSFWPAKAGERIAAPRETKVRFEPIDSREPAE